MSDWLNELTQDSFFEFAVILAFAALLAMFG
jgi:hypothetical protein